MLAYAAAGFIAIYFFAMAWPGLLSGFSHDDLMNITFALRDGWSKVAGGNFLFFSTQYRPLGGVFYLSLYDLFGWNSLPFRIVCYAALTVNLVLLYKLTRRISGSPETGILAALLLAWHGNCSALYFGSGNCYDVFAVSFYLAAIIYYARARARGILTSRNLVILAILQICALNSKEFAATIPVLLLVYEIIFHGAGVRRGNILSRAKGILLSGVLSGVYVAGKMFGPGSLSREEAYTPKISFDAYFASVASYLNDLLYMANVVTHTHAIWFTVVLIAVPFVMRNRAMLFGAAIATLAPLPVMLINPRGLASHYITLAGLAIWIAALLVYARSRFTSAIRANHFEVRYAQSAVFACLAAFLIVWHLPHRQFQIQAWSRDLNAIEQVAASLRGHREWLTGSWVRILFVNDAIPEFHWSPLFAAMLTVHNPHLQVYRLPDLGPAGLTTEALSQYSVAIEWKGNQFVSIDPRSLVRANESASQP